MFGFEFIIWLKVSALLCVKKSFRKMLESKIFFTDYFYHFAVAFMRNESLGSEEILPTACQMSHNN